VWTGAQFPKGETGSGVEREAGVRENVHRVWVNLESIANARATIPPTVSAQAGFPQPGDLTQTTR